MCSVDTHPSECLQTKRLISDVCPKFPRSFLKLFVFEGLAIPFSHLFSRQNTSLEIALRLRVQIILCFSIHCCYVIFLRRTEATDNANVHFVKYKGDYFVSTETNYMRRIDPQTLETKEKVARQYGRASPWCSPGGDIKYVCTISGGLEPVCCYQCSHGPPAL